MIYRAEGSQSAYDRVAYPDYVDEFLSPNRLRASALLHGWRPANPEIASVLEIGCGAGLSLAAFGSTNPKGRAVGFDLSSEAIDRGRTLVEAAGLKNVELHVGDALTYPRDGRKFDYIICHGVLSWVPAPVRDAIVELMGARLAPGGVGYFGYDCLPGAAAKAAIVPFLRAWVGDVADPEEAMEKAALGIAMLNRTQRKGSRLRVQLDLLIDDFPSFGPSYFFHDWLAEHYAPIDLQQFIPLAEANKLRIAGSSAGYDLVLDTFDDEARSAIEVFGDDPGHRLAALDVLLGGHIFHRDLMIRIDTPPEPSPAGITELSFAFRGTREDIEVEGTKAVSYTFGARARVSTNNAMTISVLDYLYNAKSAEIGYGELLARTGVADEHLRIILLQVSTLTLVTTSSTPQPFVLDPGERPRAGVLARAMLALGNRAVHLRGGEVQATEPETRHLIMLSDGTRTREELAVALADALKKEIRVEDVVRTVNNLARMRAFEA